MSLLKFQPEPTLDATISPVPPVYPLRVKPSRAPDVAPDVYVTPPVPSITVSAPERVLAS